MIDFMLNRLNVHAAKKCFLCRNIIVRFIRNIYKISFIVEALVKKREI